MRVKTGKKLGIWLLVCSLVLTGLTLMGERAYAAPTATFSVSAGGEASLGGTVSVTVSVSGSENMAFAQVSLNYSANVLEYQSGADSGGSGKVNLLFDCGSGQKSVSRTITFKATATGKASLSLDNAKATPMDANSGDWMNASVSGGASVNVGESKNLSADAHIASIEVSPGTLKPAFNTDVFKYTMEVENDVTSIAVTAKASHQAAKITAVNGATDLKVGANKVTVICTAENGGTAAYTITVTRKEAAAAGEKPQPTTKPAEQPTTEPTPEETELTCELNGAAYYVGQSFTEKSIPEGFAAAEIQYQNQTIKGAQFANNNEIQLIYLLNSEKKDGKFFMYYPTSGLISELVKLSFYEGNYLYLLDPSAYGATIPIDLVQTTFQMDDRELPGYTLAKPKAGVGEPLGEGETDTILENVSASPEQFVLLFGLTKEGGVSWYTYDKQEKTLQRLIVFASEEDEPEEEIVETVSDGSEHAVKKMLDTLKAYRMILLGAAAIIVLLIILCVMISINAKKKAGGEEEDDYEMIYKSLGEEESPKEKANRKKDKLKEEVAGAKKEKEQIKQEAAEAKKEINPVKREDVEATREMPSREIRRKAEKPEQAEPVPEKKISKKAIPKAEKKVSEKAVPKAEKKVSEKAAPKAEKKVSEKAVSKSEKKASAKPEPKQAEKTTKSADDDLGLEIFDIDDL